MKVFISWSGGLSHQVAAALRDWLPKVLQAVEPYVSSEDIDKGARWNSDISRELEESGFGIICVTPDNVDAPWVNFEAGALSKSLERARVAPFLFGVDRTSIQGPLLQFQSTLVDEEEVKKLLKSINKSCDEAGLDEARLDEIFEVWWPQLRDRLDAINVEEVSQMPDRSQKDILAEILLLVRAQQALLGDPESLVPPGYLRHALSDGFPRTHNSIVDPRHKVWADIREQFAELQETVQMLSDETPPPIIRSVEKLEKPLEYLLSRQYVREQRMLHREMHSE